MENVLAVKMTYKSMQMRSVNFDQLLANRKVIVLPDDCRLFTAVPEVVFQSNGLFLKLMFCTM